MKIKVPVGMLEATDNKNFHFQRDERKRLLEAALIWLDGELDRLREKHGRWEDAVLALRRMFREPEPEGIDDLLVSLRGCSIGQLDDRLREAYRRGQKNPKE